MNYDGQQKEPAEAVLDHYGAMKVVELKPIAWSQALAKSSRFAPLDFRRSHPLHLQWPDRDHHASGREVP
jgi:hypothetical protein